MEMGPDPISVTAILHFVKNRFCARPPLATLRAMRFEFEKFYQAVNAKREARAASWRQVAREIGIGKSTLARMSQNKRPDADGLAALSYWAQLNPADFISTEPAPLTAPHYSSHADEGTPAGSLAL